MCCSMAWARAGLCCGREGSAARGAGGPTSAPLLGAPGTLAVPVAMSDSSGLKQHCELGAAGRSANTASGTLSFRASHTCGQGGAESRWAMT